MRKVVPMALLLALAACQAGCICVFPDGSEDDGMGGPPQPGPMPATFCSMGTDCGSDSCCYQGSCYASTPTSPGPCMADSDCPQGQRCDVETELCAGAPDGGLPARDGGSSWGGGASGGTSGGTNGGTSGGTNGSTSGGSTSGGSSSGGSSGSAGGADGGCAKDLGGVLVGNPCASDVECGPGGVCGPALDLASGPAPTVWSEGYCTAIGCGPNAPCPKGSTCFTLPGSSAQASLSVCLADCGQSACRRPGYDCSAVGSIWACLPECATDQDCGQGLVCDGTACAPPCGADADCGAGEVCAAHHCQAAPPQSCCACEPCAHGQSCIAGFCATACQVDADCAPGERCGASGVCG